MELKYPAAVLDFLSAFTQSERYRKSIPQIENIRKQGGAVNMCSVAEALIAEGETRGEAIGIQKGRILMLYDLSYSTARIAETLDISEEVVKDVIQKNA